MKQTEQKPLRFSFNGHELTAAPGDSIAAALAVAGKTTLGHRCSGASRGLFCGMGVCHDCLVTVNGQCGVRACMATVVGNMTVWSEDERRFVEGCVPVKATALQLLETDIIIVGAGPAGLEAAALAACNARVVVVDERGESGGQYYKPRSIGYRGLRAPDRQHRRGTDLRQRAESSGAHFLNDQSVWFARCNKASRFELRSLGPDGGYRLQAGAVILASGAYERPAQLPGWTLPGVMTIGALQTLARRYGVVPGQRVLIAGHGPLGLQLAAELCALGVRVVALAERGRPQAGSALYQAFTASPRLVVEGVRYRLTLARAGIPVLQGWELSRVVGESHATGAVLHEIATGRTRHLDADIIAAGDGFAPQLELSRLLGVPVRVNAADNQIQPERQPDGSTAVAGVWIAGDAGGLGGAEIAECQGKLSAAGALTHLGFSSTGGSRETDRNMLRAQRFQSALWTLYKAPERTALDSDTVLCRCEEITAGKVCEAIAHGADDPAVLKRATRIGMGRCQGRYCLPQALRLLAKAGHAAPVEALFAPQLPARPILLGALCLEKPEWSGHRESAPAIRPARSPVTPLACEKADLVVIGGGVTGIAASLYAARTGASVVCLERGRLNGEASGGNAGSLHLQLLSWDFGGKAVGNGNLQLRTLPLQQESLSLWQQLESELDGDFETQITGGMMLAESPEQIRFLEAKCTAEAGVGIQTQVIDAAQVRRIVPAISDTIVAAAWCPEEGKINPLAATPALARAANDAGAVFEEHAPVTGLARRGNGYAIHTPRGLITAKRVLIAAGGWSAPIAAMLGIEIPVRGAPLQMVVTAPAPPLVPCLLAHADRHLTMKQANAGSIIIGGAWPAATNASGQTEVLPESLEGNLWVAAHTVPHLAHLHVVRSWAAMNIDIDGAPLIGPIAGFDGLSVAATANGYTLGPLMGREAAATALSGKLRPDLEAFSMARFR